MSVLDAEHGKQDFGSLIVKLWGVGKIRGKGTLCSIIEEL